MRKVIELKNIRKEYKTTRNNIEVLNGINYSFESGKLYAIKGHSGCGKTTLIKILGLMEEPSDGEYLLYNKSTKKLTDQEASYYRLNNIGYIFQEYNLNPYLKAYENIIVPMIINKKISRQERLIKSEELLEKVGLLNRKNHFPKELSGGEQQRIAIARALANNPNIIIADEPSGNLDKENEEIIFKILKKMSEEGKCIIVVSHSDEISAYADVNLILENGILNEVKNDNWFLCKRLDEYKKK